MMSEMSILSLGLPLRGKERRLWKKIERDTFGSDPNYIPSGRIKRRGEEKEFFILRRGGKDIGRAAATIDRRWITEKKENVGFIDDFVINPENKDSAAILIEHCLSALRQKGVSGVIVRSQRFPALAERNEELPSFGLPSNPPRYIDLFLENGFIRDKEWRSFRMSLPQVSEAEIEQGERLLGSLGFKIKPLNVLNRSELKGYNELVYNTLGGHFGYNPHRTSREFFLGRILAWFILRLTKRRIYILQNRSAEVVGYYSFHPDYNLARKPLANSNSGFNPFNILRLLIYLRRVKRVELGEIGLAETIRGKGISKALQAFRSKKMKEEGYTELDSGLTLVENIPVAKLAERVHDKYGNTRVTKYYTVRYMF